MKTEDFVGSEVRDLESMQKMKEKPFRDRELERLYKHAMKAIKQSGLKLQV